MIKYKTCCHTVFFFPKKRNLFFFFASEIHTFKVLNVGLERQKCTLCQCWPTFHFSYAGYRVLIISWPLRYFFPVSLMLVFCICLLKPSPWVHSPVICKQFWIVHSNKSRHVYVFKIYTIALPFYGVFMQCWIAKSIAPQYLHQSPLLLYLCLYRV